MPTTSVPAYQVSVIVDGKKLIPAPRVEFTRKYDRSADGTVRQRSIGVTLTGEVCAFAGSPDNTGAFWTQTGYPPDPPSSEWDFKYRIRNLREKLRAIDGLFAGDGKYLEIHPGDGSAPIKCVLQVAAVKYAQGSWLNVVPLTVEAETDCVHFGNDTLLGDACRLGRGDNPPEESWSLEQADDQGRTYKLSHTVTSTCKKRWDADNNVYIDGWKVARAMVLGTDDPEHPTLAGDGLGSVMGFEADKLLAQNVVTLTGYLPFNQTRSVQTDEAGGRYAVTETWLAYNPAGPTPSGKTGGKALEEMSVESRYSVENGLSTVTLSGTVTGLEERDPTTGVFVRSRYDNASLRITPIVNDIPALKAIAQADSGIVLNPNATSTTVSRNKISGVAQYSVTFDNRPGPSDSRFLSEVYSVDIDCGGQVIAEVGVVNRPRGPILQFINSTTAKSLTVTAEIVVAALYGQPEPAKPVFNPEVARAAAIGTPSQIWVKSDREGWRPRRGSYSRTTVYIYQN